jgi:hypothetical protein
MANYEGRKIAWVPFILRLEVFTAGEYLKFEDV